MATNRKFIARNGLDNNNVTITNVADPVSAQDAATLNSASNATNLTAGTVPAARLPALTGDVTTTVGTAVTVLPAATILTKLLTVDGNASGLDADLLDGLNSTDFVRATGTVTQTIGGIKTFSSDVTVNSLTVGLGAGNIATNFAIGYRSLFSNTTGFANSSVGYENLYDNTTGFSNSALGYNALRFNTTGDSNTAIGHSSLYTNTTGSNSIGLSYYSLFRQDTGIRNIGIGVFSSYSNRFGDSNISIGYTAAYNLGDSRTVTEIVVGRNYRIDAPGTTNFVAIGAANNTAGTVFNATGVGTGTGTVFSKNNNNIVLGNSADFSRYQGDNNIVIGTGANASSANVSNEITLGNFSITRFRVPGINVDWTNSTTVWTNLNDGSGSGLDADLLDGLNSSSFVRTDANSTLSGVKLTVEVPSGSLGTNVPVDLATITRTIEVKQSGGTGDAFIAFHIGSVAAFHLGIDRTTNDLFVGGWTMGAVKNKVWHAANDGAGSGLDADLLDGLNSSSFVRTDASSTIATANSLIYAGSTGGTLSIGNAASTSTNCSIKTGNGTLAIDSSTVSLLYLNYNAGLGVAFGSGASTTVAVMGPDGDLWKGAADNTGSKYWHEGNDGAGSGLDADLLDGLNTGQTGVSYIPYANSSGFVGIGIAAPVAPLNVARSVSSSNDTVAQLSNLYDNFTTNPTVTYPVLRLYRIGVANSSFASVADFGISRYESVSTNSRTQLDIKLSHGLLEVPEVTVASFRSNGCVGIGTASPGRLLDVGGSGQGNIVGIRGASNNQFNLANSANSSWGLIIGNSDSTIINTGYHYSTSGVNSPCSITNFNNDALHFGTNNLVRATINHSGDVGIGNTAPTVKLDVTGSIKANGNAVVERVAVPATATSTGTTGQIAFNATHFYCCSATNTWVRTTLATW